MGSTGSDFARYMAMDNGSNAYIIGAFNNTIVFPGSGAVASRSLISAGSRDIYLAKFDCSRSLVWKNRIGSSGNECGNFVYLSVKYDRGNYVYITGSFSGTATLTTTSGVNATLVSAGGTDIFLAKYDTSGVLQWAIRSGGTANDEGTDLCLDHTGNILSAGLYKGTATFNTLSGSTITKSSDGSEDLFLAKYSSSGTLQWVSVGTSPALDLITSVAVDPNDQIYVSICSFGASTVNLGSKSIVNAGSWGAFVAKLDSSGNWKWVNGMGAGIEETIGRMVVDDSSNVYAIVHYQGGNSSFSSTPPGTPVSLINQGSYDVGMIAMDSLGVIKWGKSVGGTGIDYGWHVIVGVDGNLVYSGTYSSTASFGNGFSLTSKGVLDGFIAFIDRSNGNTLGLVTMGGTGDDAVHMATPDNAGNIFLCGYYNGTATFGTHVLTSTGSDESFFAKLAPINTFPITATPSTTFCLGDSVFLYPVTPKLNSTFQWLKDNVPIPGETNDTLITKVAGSYKIVYYNDCNETDTSQAISINITGATFSAGPDKVICVGDSFQFNLSGMTSYTWFPSSFLNDSTIGNPYCKPLGNIQYVVKGKSGFCEAYDTVEVILSAPNVNAGTDKTICIGDSIQLNASGVTFYLWTPSTGLSDSSLQNPFCMPSDSITYIVRGRSGSCYDYDTINVNVNKVSSDAGANQLICPGDSIQLSGAGSGASVWTPATGLDNPNILNPYAKPIATTRYYLIINNNGCAATDSVDVVVSSTTSLDAGLDKEICAGDSVQLSVTGGLGYTWSPNYAIDDVNSAAPNVYPLITTDYIVTSGSGSCPAYDTVRVSVNPNPTIDAGSDQIICKGKTGTIAAIASPDANQFLWSPSTGLSDPAILQPLVTPTVARQYIIQVTNSINGCLARDTVLITIDSVVARFIAEPLTGPIPLKVYFTNQSVNATSFLWVFDSSGLNTSIETNPIHIYESIGLMHPVLYAQNVNGCIDSFTLQIDVLSQQAIFIPNVFTPNKDGINDEFVVSVLNYGLLRRLHGTIWNRWGGQIYEFTMPGGKWWDGTFEGEICSEGVYFYIIEVEDTARSIKKYHGTITLLR
jgi:gliding motility-associated-like protein